MASDVTAVIKYTREVCYLDDGEVAVLTPGSVQVYNSLLQPVEKEISHVDWEISAAEKGGYEHFMFKEIMEQPKALRDTIFPRLRGDRVVLDDLTITREELERMDRLYIIACGSSYHVGVAAKYILERLLRIPVEVTLASEFRYCDPIVTDRTLALVIYGDLDVSVIDELPPGRQKVDTFALGESYRPRVQAFIRKLAAAGQQIFIVCPLVGEADQIPDERKAVTAYAKHCLLYTSDVPTT